MQALALEVLDDLDLARLLIGQRPDDAGDRLQLEQLGGAPPAFTADDLVVAIRLGADDQRLDDAGHADGVSQFRDGLRVEAGAVGTVGG